MKKMLLMLMASIFFKIAVVAQSNSTITTTVFWKITSKNGTAPSWLLGTVHFYGGSLLDSFPIVFNKLKKSSLYIGEVNNPQMNPSLHRDSNIYVPYTKLLKNDEYSLVNSYFLKMFPSSGGLATADSLKFPAYLLLYQVFLNKINETYFNTIKSDESAIDFYLANFADSIGLKTIGLDSFSDRKVNPNIIGTPKQCADAIVDAVNFLNQEIHSPFIDRYFQEMKQYDDYKKMEIKYSFDIPTPNKKSPIVREIVMKRNNDWLKVLPSFLNNGNCFIVVGLGHLMYKEGLIMRIRKMGYTVEPVLMK